MINDESQLDDLRITTELPDNSGKEFLIKPDKMYPLKNFIIEEIKQRGSNCIVACGESPHHSENILRFEADLVEVLAREGLLRGVFLEERRSMQKYVDRFLKEGILDPPLWVYLTEDFLRMDQIPNTLKLKLLDCCRRNVIPVYFFDVNRIEFPQ